MTVLSCNNLSYEISNNEIINNISFSINEGDKLGIIGINGSGKSTLINLITTALFPTNGNIYIAKNKRIGCYHQNEMLNSDLSIYDEMLTSFKELIDAEKYLDEYEHKFKSQKPTQNDINEFERINHFYISNGGLEYKGRISSTLQKFGFLDSDFERKVNTLSGGERSRLAIIKLLIVNPDILILDEPTNHLDMKTLNWLETYLVNFKNTLIVVSHDRYFLDNVTNKILEIENKHGTLYNGNYSKYVTQKEERKKAIEKQYSLQEKEIKRIEEMIEQQRRWGQEHNFVTIKSKEKQIERLKVYDKPEKEQKSISLKFKNDHNSGNDVLIIENLCKYYSDKLILSNLNLLVKRKERLLIIGNNGCGKSTLLKILSGSEHYNSGNFEWGFNVHYCYFSQEQDNLNLNKTLFDEISDCYPNLTNTEIRNALAKFQFRADDVFKLCSNLSGGEKVRLAFCKIILSKYNVLILDEPTNHLDIQSREVLENALDDFEGTIIAVSHDRYFIEKLSTRILDLSDKNNYIQINGNYKDYLDYLEKVSNEITENKIKISNDSDNKKIYLANKQLASNIKKTETKISKLEEKINNLELEKEDLYKEIEQNPNNHVLLQDLCDKIVLIDNEIDNLYIEIEQTELILNQYKEIKNE